MNCKECDQESKLVGSNSDREYSTMLGKSYDFYECELCMYLVIEPMEITNLSVIYPDSYYSYKPDGYNWMYKLKFLLDANKYKKVTKKFIDKEINIIDIGGGTGEQLNILKNAHNGKVKNSIVIDLDSKSAPYATANGHQFVCSQFEKYTSTEKVDIILALNILEHVVDPKDFLLSIRKNLSSHGVAIIQTPNYKALDYKIFRKTYWGGFHTPRHFFIFSEDSLRKIIDEAGLSVLLHKYIPAGPFWTFSLISWINTKLNLSWERPQYENPLFTPLVIIFTIFDGIRGLLGSKTSQQWLVVSLKPNE